MGLAAFNRSRLAAAEAARLAAEKAQEAEEGTLLEELREKAAALGIPNAERKGEKRLLEEIAGIEEAAKLEELKAQAAEIGIDIGEATTAEEILALIEVHKAADTGGSDGKLPE